MTRTQAVIGGVGLLVLIGAGVAIFLKMKGSPPDTPIVIGGGSIHGLTYDQDTDGWGGSASSGKVSASVHGYQDAKNPYGIDALTFTNFDPVPPGTNPGYQVTGTGGWSIIIRNPLPGSGPKHIPNTDPAVLVCSDSDCTVYYNKCNAASFDPKGPVYFSVRSGAQIYTTLGGPGGKATQRVDFHDTLAGCTAQTCDLIYDVTVKTCNGGSIGPLTCNVDSTTTPQVCAITIGHGP